MAALAMALTGVLALACASGCPEPDEAPGDKAVPPLAALMYLWYGFDLATGESIGGLGSSRWNTPGVESAHRRGATDEPAYRFYSSDDVSVIEEQLADMESAGISVILISWWGWGDSDWDGVNENRESEGMVRAANVLLGHISDNCLPFKVAFVVEPYMREPSAEEMTLAHKQAILDRLWDTIYKVYPDLMFHWDNKPLVVTWDPVRLKEPEDPRFTVKTWGSYFGGPDWKTESSQDWNWYPNLEWLDRMISDDGMYVVFPRFDEYWLYLGGYTPGYPHRRVDPLLTEGAYERTWQVAVENKDRIGLLVLYTWNEHKEHAAIEPDKGVSHLSYGRSLVEKTAKFYQSFLAGQAIPTPSDSRQGE